MPVGRGLLLLVITQLQSANPIIITIEFNHFAPRLVIRLSVHQLILKLALMLSIEHPV